MFMKVTFLILITRFPYKTCASRVCIPKSQAVLNGKVCHCSNLGHWLEAECYARRQTNHHICTPGHIIFQGCNRCVCHENGKLTCTKDAGCSGRKSHPNVHESLTNVMPWCSPYRTYYFKCNICICPASAISSESHCAIDTSCTSSKEPSLSEMIFKKTACIPTVMYLFSCLHCLCSDEGYFSSDKCVKTCAGKQPEIAHRCYANSIYRKDCNVCFCPETGISDNKLCTNATCTYPLEFKSLRSLESKHINCTPHTFTKPNCVYCNCNNNGNIDERSCLEHECLISEMLRPDGDGKTCKPGEVASICTECFCSRNSTTSKEFCSKSCTSLSELKVLQNIFALQNFHQIVDKEVLERNDGGELCKPHTVFLDKEKYCLCPDTGITNVDFCTAPGFKNIVDLKNKTNFHIAIDFNSTCEPSTFVEFDCNTCFCSKHGKIDPKWCTYDDCESKRIIQDSHIFNTVSSVQSIEGTCDPGSISNFECNFCICPENGKMENRICTKNDCRLESISKSPNSTNFQFSNNTSDNFICEPLTYYEVDCNVCLCPRDGIKNVVKCTKNDCEKSILRSVDCVPGQLFSSDCNVCVCPPNGNIADSACTTYTCDAVPWSKIFQLSESLIGNQITEDETRNLDLCFPGEEYFEGCKLCRCPDMGLRIYATCSAVFCDEDRREEEIGDTHDILRSQEISGSNRAMPLYRKLNSRREICTTVNYSTVPTRKECTPGSMYILGCRQCICPLQGDIKFFCRPIPKNFYCEQPYPGFDYLPMGRRNEKALNLTANRTATSVVVEHIHTRYECKKHGHVMDDCYMCKCDGKVLIVEHCFQSNSSECVDASPTFLQDYVKPDRKTKKP
ncbi:hypothetical protein O0L34_g3582 [Tuta absoluta]|nr:hypothetical protein O0L34_g3582 [Tuta absoluta]